ncbi:hypothetical protein I6E74_02955 [Salinibacterium sp. SWN139]|uniref:hypothetical protein n=1 Tax=Salinibacterium sp. SWN139 TaxID=2792055 RepID=UPI0018CCA4E5|nr:hypothetical protein [Salinibacterium sp. SWN139]MBH0053128.1 hypothetical protein [Salinibacterium sp. SWN139]
MNATLPEGFTRLAIDARRPLPLSATVRVNAGSFRLILVATPDDVAGIVARPLDSPWFDGAERRVPSALRSSNIASALHAGAASMPEGIRPTAVVVSATGVLWARPVVMGRIQHVVESAGAGHLFDIAIAACELRSASLVAPANVGAEINIGVRDVSVGSISPTSEGARKDPYDSLR